VICIPWFGFGLNNSVAFSLHITRLCLLMLCGFCLCFWLYVFCFMFCCWLGYCGFVCFV